MTSLLNTTPAAGLNIAHAPPAMVSFFHDLERAAREREATDAERDPKRYALTLVMSEGANTNYTVFQAGMDRTGAEIRFCVSCHRNAAGLFLFWHERRTRNRITRTHWEALRDKRLAFSWAKRCAAEWRRERAGAGVGRVQ